MTLGRYLWGAGALTGGAILLTSGQVAAQAERSAAAQAVLEEIMVTSRRREENLLELPLSIAAFTAEQMQTQGIYNIDDASDLVPNVTLATDNRANNNRVIIRGIGGGHPDPVFVFGSGMYIDGHYMPNSIGGYMSTVDIERIELLRGPQGTLFGKNVTGGAVNIISTKPQPEFDSSITLRLAEDGDENIRAMINVPFGEKVYGRFSAASEQFDGYYYNQYLNIDSGTKDHTSVNAAVRFEPTEQWTIDANVNVYRGRDDALGGQCFGDPTGTAPLWGGGAGNLEVRLYPGAHADFLALCAADVAAGDFVNSSDKYTFSDVDTESAFVTAQWAGDDLTFKINASTRDLEYRYISDRDYTSWPVDHIGTVSEVGTGYINNTEGYEFLLEGSPSDRLQFTVGVNYFEEEAHQGGAARDACRQGFVASGAINDPSITYICDRNGLFFELVPDNPTGTGLWPDGPRANPNGPGPFWNNVSVWNESVGVFGHVTYALNDNWDLDVGARWTEDDRTFSNIEFAVSDCDISITDPRTLCFVTPAVDQGVDFFNTASDTFDEITPMISLTRNLAGSGGLDSGMVYFLYSEGFLTGGFNTEINSNLPAVAQFLSYEPENVTNYEIGFKGRFADGNIQFMADVFFMDYENQQRDLELANPNFIYGADDPIGIVQNVASSSISGLELELRAVPWDGGLLSVDWGIIENDYDEYNYVDPADPSQIVDLTQTLIPDFTPDMKLNIAIAHEFQLAGGARLTPRLHVFWSDEYEWAANQGNWPKDAPPSPIFQDSYTKLDVRLGYTPANGDWQLALFGYNITDEKIIDFAETQRSVWRGRLERPAYWGVEFSSYFGR
jgi:iron complex outermembrane receptor protein